MPDNYDIYIGIVPTHNPACRRRCVWGLGGVVATALAPYHRRGPAAVAVLRDDKASSTCRVRRGINDPIIKKLKPALLACDDSCRLCVSRSGGNHAE